ncbi:MAG: transcriptional regulator with GAF, ATPase, and Fis domain [Desulforhopalus sp.]|jgi:transcriptional regulator with GAF, ATPase, and Fis domain
MELKLRDFFRQVTIRICGSLDINEALADTFSYIKTVMPADALGMVHFDLVRGKIISVAKVEKEGTQTLLQGQASETIIGADIVNKIKGEDKNLTVSMNNSPENLSESMLNLFPSLRRSSFLSLRLQLNDQMIGKFVVAAEGLNRYTEENVKLLETVMEPIAIALSNARRYRELHRSKEMLAEDNQVLIEQLKRFTGIEVVGGELGLKEVMNQVEQVAQSNSPTLLLGETGTGKEVIADAIHMASRRQGAPLVTMQCGAVPDSLLDSELFGHEKGAFTGASATKRGRFERADKGTLFLDEVGELSLEAQVKLLRVLQEKRFERVGGTKTIQVDVRVIAATHRDLEKMVEEGTFREDLWYRLNVFPIRIPPLRLRREDIPGLVQYFVSKQAKDMNLLRIPQIEEYEIERLKNYDWPGNVRELQNVVERALLVSKGAFLHFPPLKSVRSHQIQSSVSDRVSEGLSLDDMTRQHIRLVLNRVGGKIDGQGGAAEILQLNPSTLRFRMKKLGIQRKKLY